VDLIERIEQGLTTASDAYSVRMLVDAAEELLAEWNCMEYTSEAVVAVHLLRNLDRALNMVERPGGNRDDVR